MERIRVVSYFCGCGGMDLGLSGGFSYLGKKYGRLPFDIVYALDNDPYCTKIYNANFKHKCVVKDVKDINIDNLPDFDLLIGGFPCQSFSISAQNPPRLGYKDERGMLFFEMVKVLKARRPRFFIAENVKGLLSANRGKAFPMIIDEFENAGYNVKYKIVNAVEYGVPQKRERIIIVGFREEEDYKNFYFPPTLTHKIALKEVIDADANNDEKWFFSQKAVEGMMRVRDKMNKGRVQDISQPCNTISSHLAKVSLNSTDPVLETNNRFRRFTPLEAARIQSFPDDFRFDSVSDIRKYKAIGNAVPPVMMWYISKSLTDCIGSCLQEDNEDANLNFEPRGMYNPVQLSFFEPTAIYYSGKNNTLIGACRKGNMEWIKEQKMYNYPITDAELKERPQLLKVKHLLVKYRKSVVGYYDIVNARVVDKAALKELGYPSSSSRHKADTKYVLYDIVESENAQPIIETSDCQLIIGKGVKQK